MSMPIVKAWRELKVGSPLYMLDDMAKDNAWLEHALIQRITVQTGIWFVELEDGYSVFRIYPYLSIGEPTPAFHQGIVLKIKGNKGISDIKDAIHKRMKSVVIDEFDVFGNGISIHRYSRKH